MKLLAAAAILMVAAAAAAPAQPVEDWRKLEVEGHVLELDLHSVREKDGERWLRTRLDDGGGDIRYIDTVVVCATAMFETRHMETVNGGKVTGSRDFAPGERSHHGVDELSSRILALVCPREGATG